MPSVTSWGTLYPLEQAYGCRLTKAAESSTHASDWPVATRRCCALPELARDAAFSYRRLIMGIANSQNLVRSVPALPRPYGIRVSLRPGDPFAKLLGSDWQKTHWYFTAVERDHDLEEMARRHEYSRIGDQPVLVHEKIENLSESRSF